ncbi:MAG: histidine kinase [Candidatus Marinimicrobia bacterium]|nr:histidine kinase [Candidatus Neomarinimicrobiota bacterium]
MSISINRNQIFWLLQFAGWGIYWLYIITNAAYLGYYGLRYITWNTLVILIGFSLTVITRYIYRMIIFTQLPIYKIFLIAITSTAITVNLWYGLRLLVNQIMIQPGEHVLPVTLNYYLQSIFLWSILIFVWNSLYFLIKFSIEFEEQAKRTENAGVLARKAQLQMLQYQLNPHFLFNSLNSIRALIDENETTAKEMITELSEFLRYTLLNEQYIDVPLRYEIEALRHYFSIEKKRYEDKLNILFDIDSPVNDFPVISFLLHPLVENAIKYGMLTSPMPLKIQIIARIIDHTLMLEVRNTGHWVEPSSTRIAKGTSTGTGLSNIRLRLDNAFRNRYNLDVIQTKSGVCVKIEIRRKP